MLNVASSVFTDFEIMLSLFNCHTGSTVFTLTCLPFTSAHLRQFRVGYFILFCHCDKSGADADKLDADVERGSLLLAKVISNWCHGSCHLMVISGMISTGQMTQPTASKH